MTPLAKLILNSGSGFHCTYTGFRLKCKDLEVSAADSFVFANRREKKVIQVKQISSSISVVFLLLFSFWTSGEIMQRFWEATVSASSALNIRSKSDQI